MKVIVFLIVLFAAAMLMGLYQHRMPPFDNIPQHNRYHGR